MLLIITLKTSRPIEVFRMPNPLWENSGGTHELSIKSGHLHKIFEDECENYDRFMAPEPLVREEGLWDVSAESAVMCPQVGGSMSVICPN